jgi:hypothetical protein
MNDIAKKILNESGINFNTEEEINGILIPREILLDFTIYEKIKDKIPDLKKVFSSSSLTSLQKNANMNQKWPLLNLVRQILAVYNYHLMPIRKSDGYTLDGVKKFKRYFRINKVNKNASND